MIDCARETAKCLGCGLVQFVASHRNCRRCKRSVDPAPLVEVPAPAAVPVEQPVLRELPTLALRVLRLRRTRLLSQSQLAERMHVPRTYISKIERGHAVPTLRSLQKIADALDVPISNFFESSPVLAPRPMDVFLAEIARHLPRLTQHQLHSILSLTQRLAAASKERAA